jgi:excinuclease ABC subunit B
VLYPARHHVLDESEKEIILQDIGRELEARCATLLAAGRTLEEARLRQRTENDLLMLRMVDTCKGVENYSRHLARRPAGAPPDCLVDYYPQKDWLLLVDESHVTAPQVKGMYEGDRRRKSILVEHGFRLPSALDNRPLRAEEFWGKANQCVFISATPGRFEKELSTWDLDRGEATGAQRAGSASALSEAVTRLATTPRFGVKGAVDVASAGPLHGERDVWWDAEAIIRPTGIIDPAVHIRPSQGQVDDLLYEIINRSARDERVLVTTLTKRMAEDLVTYFQDSGVKSSYIHSNVKPLARLEILQSLREGGIDVLVGVNLLREGLNLPEVSLVVILDADKEGFLRSDTALIQTIGRATRNVHGEAVLYADVVTKSMQRALDETARRRAIQLQYNMETGMVPTTATSVRGGTEDTILETIQKFHTSNDDGATKERGGAGKRSFEEFEATKLSEAAAVLEWEDEENSDALASLRDKADEKMSGASAMRRYDEAAWWRDTRDSIQRRLESLRQIAAHTHTT